MRLTSGSPGLAGYIVGLFPGCEGRWVNIPPPWWLSLASHTHCRGCGLRDYLVTWEQLCYGSYVPAIVYCC